MVAQNVCQFEDEPRLGSEAVIAPAFNAMEAAWSEQRSEAINDTPIQYVHRAVVCCGERGLTRLEASKGVKSEVYGMYA